MEDNDQKPQEHLGEIPEDIATLKGKSVSGFGWATVQQLLGRLTTFSVNLVLARLLVPEDFGVVAILNIFLAISLTLADAGFAASLARTEHLDEEDTSTVFYFNIAMGFLLYSILFVAAPWVAGYFHNPVLVDVLRVQALSFVISSLGSVPGILIWRKMKFRQETYIQILQGMISGGVGICMALAGFRYWALVGLAITNAMTRAILLFYFSGWRPKLIFSKERLKHHFAFGSRMAVSRIIVAIYDNLTLAIIGRNFSTRSLGLYNNANSLYVVPVATIADPIYKVTYPVLVKMQKDPERLRAGYSRMIRLLFQLSCPVMVLLISLSTPLYHFLYGDKWMEAAPFFQILCICGVLYPINAYNTSILEVTGRSDLHLRLEVARRIIGVILIFTGLLFGIYGLLWSAVIIQVFYLYINSYYSGRIINYPLRQQLAELIPFALMAAVAGATVWALDNMLLSSLADFWRLSLGSVAMGVVYLLLAYLFTREDLLYVWRLILHHVLRRPAHQS
jgi:lipopolysaccharide biosynthesis protein wzxC